MKRLELDTVPKQIFYLDKWTFLNLIQECYMSNTVENLEEKRFLNDKEVEDLYGFSRSWLSKQRCNGKSCSSNKTNFPYIKLSNYIRYDRQQIDAYLLEHAVR